MSLQQPLRIAFLGGHGHHYLRAALEDETLRIAAIAACPGYEDATESRQRFGEAEWHGSLDALLDAFKPDVLNVGTVYARQGPFIAASLARGVPVVCDKPVAGTWDDLREIERALAAPNAPVLATEFDFRARATFRAAAKAVADGLVGEPVLATAQKSYRFGNRADFYRRREDYGSTLLWIASHGIDAIRFVTGQSFASVVAQHGNVAKPDYDTMEDHAAAVYTLANGATGLVHADLLRPAAAPTHGDDRLRVVGSLGQIEVRSGRCTLVTHDQSERDLTDTVAPQPLHRELLAAVLERNAAWYSSGASLELARVLLTTRDAADRGERLALNGE